ncbi:nicotinamide N-methyltransferase [Lentinula edodes]|uniref:Nicotinamide N-methyltransferase n=1 Tax=Lentinula edodes TaxID=5353 RepID=A0A1Q3ER98_LENED|nr:nicotinamide N-methyltransferase [Lentinula edodes]
MDVTWLASIIEKITQWTQMKLILAWIRFSLKFHDYHRLKRRSAHIRFGDTTCMGFIPYISFSSYLEQRPSLCQHKSILELGAGGALPSLVAAESGARKHRS